MTDMPRFSRLDVRDTATKYSDNLGLLGGAVALVLCVMVLVGAAVKTAHPCLPGDPSLVIGGMLLAGCPPPVGGGSGGREKGE
jgi:hypothetical protein